MRVRIAGSHHLAAIFENLHVANHRHPAQFGILRCPGIDHQLEIRRRHARYGQIVARRKTGYPADARLTFRNQQPFAVRGLDRCAWQHRGEVVVEYEGAGVVGITRAARSRVTRAEIAARVIRRLGLLLVFLHLPLPGSLRAMRRDQHPRSVQDIKAAMRVLRQIGAFARATGVEESAIFEIVTTLGVSSYPSSCAAFKASEISSGSAAV